MSTYDAAHTLANVLKNSIEYQELLKAQKTIENDEQAKKMVKEFIAKQMEIEFQMMSGKPEDKEQTTRLQKMYELLALNTKSRDFLQAYMRFQRMMADVYKIIGEATAEGLNFIGK
ncbi:hypothetical protein P22_2998 [Propionispora sp. 2/2-37]|uniref:YlbF family regulator n=1 Tax=Propionispora sp. 2/2-37 TaxID=1677858 RepID=UPI0006BB8FCA|nr:YlbF family regulator [Propionispora sp. 2/2-37]CUH96886.1 hypothetical protein P22_2998 [Propionispora sp. 2/2-37]